VILEEEIPKRFVHGKGTFIWVGYQNRACLFLFVWLPELVHILISFVLLVGNGQASR